MTHYLFSVWNSYEQNFFSREFRGISELYKVGVMQNKKTHQSVLIHCYEKNFEENISFIWLLKRETYLLALSHFF